MPGVPGAEARAKTIGREAEAIIAENRRAPSPAATVQRRLRAANPSPASRENDFRED